LLSVLWWAWSAYAWLTNTLDPEEGSVRMAMLAAIAAMLIASLAAPPAFRRDATTFAVAYLIVRALHLVLYALAGRGDRELLRAVQRILPPVALSAVLLLVASPLHGTAKLVCWGAAAAVDYVGPLIGHMRGWRLSPRHFVERFGQVILIALGESVVAIGVGAARLELGPGLVTAVLLGITVVACLWRSYFDWVVYVVQTRLAETAGLRRPRSPATRTPTSTSPWSAASSCSPSGSRPRCTAQPSRWRSFPRSVSSAASRSISWPTSRFDCASADSDGGNRSLPSCWSPLLPIATHMPAAGALGMVATVCIALIAYEVIRYREGRALIRARRGALTTDDIARFEDERP
jgi:hypothetical protein